MAYLVDSKLAFADGQSFPATTATLSQGVLDFGRENNTRQGSFENIVIYSEKKADFTIEILTGSTLSGANVSAPETIQVNTVKGQDQITIRMPDNRKRYLQLKITSSVATKISAWGTKETTPNK